MKNTSPWLLILLLCSWFTKPADAQSTDSLFSLTLFAGPMLPVTGDLYGGGIGMELELPHSGKTSLVINGTANFSARESFSGDLRILLLPSASLGPRWYIGKGARKVFIEAGVEALTGLSLTDESEGGGGFGFNLGLGYRFPLSRSLRMIVRGKGHAIIREGFYIYSELHAGVMFSL